MKKFLSMVLALVMAMSLVTISAGAADFTDKDSIDYLEAVEVMTAVGVVDGYTDGSFGPNGYLTRGAAAKIICNLILGPTTSEALVADAAPYSDVPTSNVFAGYIAYCQKEGIISGYADGTFRPGNPLTGYAFMKMLLGALGYDAEKEGYTGNNWSINVAKQALAIDLDDDLEGEFNGVKTVTRQEALLYAFNTMKATMVEYDNNTSIVVGDVTVSTSSSKSDVESTNKVKYDGEADDKMQFCEKYFDDLKVEVVTDDFGRPANKWTWDNEKVGTYGKKADLVYTTDAKIYNVRKDLDLSNSDNAYFTIQVNSDIAYPGAAGDYDVTWNENLEGKTYLMPTAVSSDSYKAMSNWLGSIMNVEKFEQEYSFDNAYFKYYYGNREIYYPSYGGTTTEVYFDKDDKDEDGNYYGTIVVIEQQMAEIAAVKTDDDGRYVTFKKGDGSSSIMSDWKYYTNDFAKGDVVTFTVGKYGDTDECIYDVALAEVVSGTVNYINGSTYVVLDGNGYYMYSNNWVGNFGITAGDEIDAYLAPNGRIMSIVTTAASKDVSKMVLLEDAIYEDGKLGDNKAYVIFGDGTTQTVSMDEDYDSSDYEYHVWNYSYSGSDMKLKEMAGYTDSGKIEVAEYVKGATKIGGYNIDADTQFVYIDEDDDTRTYAGYKNIPGFENGTVVVLTKNSDKAATLVYVWVDDDNITSSSSSDYVLAIADKYYKWTTVDEDDNEENYYAIRTLAGNYLYIDATAKYSDDEVENVYLYNDSGVADMLYSLRFRGVVVMDNLTYDTDTGYVTKAKLTDDVNVLAASTSVASSEFAVEYKNGVLYIDDVPYTLDDEVEVYVIANNGDSYVEGDVTDLDDVYMGYTLIANDDDEVETVVLKETP